MAPLWRCRSNLLDAKRHVDLMRTFAAGLLARIFVIPVVAAVVFCSGWSNIRPTPLGVFSCSTSISGSFNNPYNFPSLKADFIPMQAPVSTGPWRSVMYPARVFARESFVDEMAVTAGIDPSRLSPAAACAARPIEGRQPEDRSRRLIKVRQLAAEKSNWKIPLSDSADRFWGTWYRLQRL